LPRLLLPKVFFMRVMELVSWKFVLFAAFNLVIKIVSSAILFQQCTYHLSTYSPKAAVFCPSPPLLRLSVKERAKEKNDQSIENVTWNNPSNFIVEGNGFNKTSAKILLNFLWIFSENNTVGFVSCKFSEAVCQENN
jgi:hypothetical protein